MWKKALSSIFYVLAIGLLATTGIKLEAKSYFDTPVVSCSVETPVSIYIQVCAGESGAPAGFSLQWMTLASYIANGNMWYSSEDPRLCKASFSGNANLSRYNLGSNECTIVNIGELLFDNGASSSCTSALMCGTEYVFRAFVHANSKKKRSDFSENHTCSTMPCNQACPEYNCTYTQGYWKTHGPSEGCGCLSGNNTNNWPMFVTLRLGTYEYTNAEICCILKTPAAGNGLIILAHQLIAAKLNILKGADASAISLIIDAADAAIGGLVIPPIGAWELSPDSVSSYVNLLTQYNEGAIGPGHCCE